MGYTTPIYMGQFPAVKASDIVDFYFDIAGDLATGETISSVAFTFYDSSEVAVPGVVTQHAETESRTDFRLAVPATVGQYTVEAVFTISDGQKLTRRASVWVQ